MLLFCPVNRMWLTKTRLKNVRFKIVIFKPELLKGKMPKDSVAQEAAQPVSEK